jgi:hypothetical protein
MYMNRATILALASLLPALTMQSALLPRQRGCYCETSTGSPKTEDITNVINELHGYDADAICAQTNDAASQCTTLVSHNSAAISICGGLDDTTNCQDVAKYANIIQQQCLNTGLERSGGQYVISPSLRVEVISS